MSEEDLRNERLKKLDALRAAGVNPYPASTEASATIAQVLENFETLSANDEEVSIAGRIMALRGQGAIMFCDLYDGSERMQTVIQKGQVEDALFQLFFETVDIGDFIQVSVVPFTTKRGEKSVQVSEWRMLSKSLRPIPSEWYGVKDEETRLRERTIDMLVNPELHAMVIRRAKFWQAIREFLLKRDFLEVETPALETTPGGADARPFVTHHNALDIEVHLRISAGELWQKRLLIAGFPKVFEIGRIFRNEGQSREHLQDYTQLETYEAYSDMKKGG